MKRLNLAVFNTQPPHLYFGGVERRIMEVAKTIIICFVLFLLGIAVGYELCNHVDNSDNIIKMDKMAIIVPAPIDYEKLGRVSFSFGNPPLEILPSENKSE